ncbi:hypothetical protein ATCC90586_009238 [Pythium insidiosum]|nr:hypothetical protein ATCC90586_009238 [Pythium insidiosum]
MVKILRVALAIVAAVAVVAGQPANNTTQPNWVGPKVGKPIDNACYRKSYPGRKCPPGYESDKIATCWARCPIEYPVECGMECLPQNQDCTLAVLRKVGAVAKTVLKTASSFLFKDIQEKNGGVKAGIVCGQQLQAAITKIVGYVGELKRTPDNTKDQIWFLLNKSNFVTVDLPQAVATCKGLPAAVEPNKHTEEVIKIVKMIVERVIGSPSNGQDLLDASNLVSLGRDVGLDSITSLKEDEVSKLKAVVSAGITCGTEIKNVIDKVVKEVVEIKKKNPDSSVELIRYAIMNSQTFLRDVPQSALKCVDTNMPQGFKTRDEILRSVNLMVDRVVEAASQNGNPVSVDKYVIAVANLGLDAISVFDPTGIADLAKEFVQPICSPTSYVGEIDDGPADQALGMKTMQKAFRGSTGQWIKNGNGKVTIVFESVDDKDVTVNIMIGGDVLEKVKVPRGTTVTWTKPTAELQDNTLYLDRWRPGFLGLPGKGGGSLLLWIPHSQNGQLDLRAKINPTSLFNADRQ